MGTALLNQKIDRRVLHQHGASVPLTMRTAATLDALVAAGSLWFAAVLRFEGSIPSTYRRGLLLMTPIFMAIIVVALASGRLYRTLPEYISDTEILMLGVSVGIASIACLAVSIPWHLIPRSVPLIQAPILFVGLGAIRFRGRIARLREGHRRSKDAETVLIIGAGNAGESIVRDIQQDRGSRLTPIGFLDDDRGKRGCRIHGVPVLGTTADVEDMVERHRPDHVIIAMPAVPMRAIRPLLTRVVATGVPAKILPSLREIVVRDRVTTADIRDVDIADLLGREPVRIDSAQIAEHLHGRTVLITGAAGSIGRELARQALSFRPGRLLLLDNNETEVFYVTRDLCGGGVAVSDSVVEMIVGDIRDASCMDRLFEQHRPDVVFHAAAYKHVPVMELYPGEAVKANVVGTRNVVTAAARCGASRFVLVSTDKAVRPENVMGATKCVAEMIVARAAASSSMVVASVRFGNVLGSRGSVVPIFAKQIQQGGPLTVTHPDVTRYFMTIEEAASLILEAGAFARGGETFVLDMGEPVRILELARRMRDLMARERSEEIEIVFTGLRPGEKLHENLTQWDEVIVRSSKPRILRATGSAPTIPPAAFEEAVCYLERLSVQQAPPEEIRAVLFRLARARSGAAPSANGGAHSPSLAIDLTDGDSPEPTALTS